MNFGSALKEAREASGWRQEDVAKRLGVTQQAVQRWESSENPPVRSEYLPDLCRILGIEFDAENYVKTNTALSNQVGGNHYKNYAIQPVEFIERNRIPFLEACVIKRMCRHEAKNGAEDLRKAIHEIKLILELRYGEKDGD